MKKRASSKASLFLLEMMISILFFSIAAAVCVQVFAKAHLLSRDAADLNMAVSCASTAAEVLSQAEASGDLMEAFPGSREIEKNLYRVYYNEDWSLCEQEQAYVQMEIAVTEEEQMRQGNIVVSRTDAEGDPIYQLEVSKYLPQSMEAGQLSKAVQEEGDFHE